MLKENWKPEFYESRCWRERESFLDPIGIKWCGMTSTLPVLVQEGWNFSILTNRFTGKKKLYMRHLELRLVGRCSYPNEGGSYEMDFITGEHNQFASPPKIRVENEEVIGIEYDDIPLILQQIAILQKERLDKPKPEKADIIEFIRKVS